jgi:hypothetical protein
MTLAIIAGAGFALGVTGLALGLHPDRPSLQDVLAHLSVDGEPSEARASHAAKPHATPHRVVQPWRVDLRLGGHLATAITHRAGSDGALQRRLALVGTTLDVLCAQCALSGFVGFALPGVMWLVLTAGAVHLPVLIPLWIAVLTGVAGATFPVFVLEAQVKRAQRQATRVICSFLDLVVLGLAAGMGIESALLTAAQAGETEISLRMLHALTVSRETGEAPWEALLCLGTALGLDDLCEVASTAGMAGTEGARVRVTLAARAASIRRHELATTEADANAMTEKLFLPGAFLLLGFLLFIGFPAFTRIASGF